MTVQPTRRYQLRRDQAVRGPVADSEVVRCLKHKISHHNAALAPGSRVTLETVLSVYWSGLKDYHQRPPGGVTADQYAQTHVTSFLSSLKGR